MADPRTITVEQSAGCLRFAGLLALLCCVLGVVLLLTGSGFGDPFWIALTVLGVVVTLPLGIALMFGRAGVTVDVQRREVRVWRTLLGITLKDVRTPLSSLRNIAILRERVKGQETFAYLYHVQLLGPSTSIELVAPGHYEDARARADELVKLTKLTLIDGEYKRLKGS